MNREPEASKWRRLARILAGEDPGDDLRDADGGEDGSDDGAVDEARAIWSLTDPDPDAGSDWNVFAGWERLDERLREEEPRSATPSTSREPSRIGRRAGVGEKVVKAAAGLLVAASVLWALEIGPFGISSDPASRTFSTSSGQRLELRLPEGSRVEVGPESELTLLEGFHEGDRAVRLRGLAFFDVDASERRPFVVRMRQGSARAMGTKFSVRAYEDEDRTRVLVKEGRVGVDADDDSAPDAEILAAGEVGVFSRDGAISVGTSPVERALAWRNGTISFDETSLRRLARELERWYGIDVTVGDASIADRRFTGDFTHESMTQIVEIVSASLDVGYRVRDSTVVFVAQE